MKAQDICSLLCWRRTEFYWTSFGYIELNLWLIALGEPQLWARGGPHWLQRASWYSKSWAYARVPGYTGATGRGKRQEISDPWADSEILKIYTKMWILSKVWNRLMPRLYNRDLTINKSRLKHWRTVNFEELETQSWACGLQPDPLSIKCSICFVN